jgi:hypothetical protein
MENNRELDNIFDECLERILTGEETVEQCLASYPEHAAELEPLLQTVLNAKEALDIKPRPGFKERARNQILAELKDTEERKRRRFFLFGWQPRWATAAIAILVLLIASSSTVAAASNSMPDGLLYPVKLATEETRLALTPSALGKAEYYAELVDRRVNEIVSMADKGKLEQVEKTTRKMNNQLMAMEILVGKEEGAPEVLTAPAAEPGEAREEAPAMLVAPEEPEPEVTTPSPPPEAAAKPSSPARAGEPQKEKPEVAAVPARPAPEKAPALAPSPASVPPPGNGAEKEKDEKESRQAKLRAILARNAAKHPEALQAALQEAPEPIRQALRNALETSNIEYEKLLQLLEAMEDEAEDEGEAED